MSSIVTAASQLATADGAQCTIRNVVSLFLDCLSDCKLFVARGKLVAGSEANNAHTHTNGYRHRHSNSHNVKFSSVK